VPLKSFLGKFIVAYFDDIVVYSKDRKNISNALKRCPPFSVMKTFMRRSSM